VLAALAWLLPGPLRMSRLVTPGTLLLTHEYHAAAYSNCLLGTPNRISESRRVLWVPVFGTNKAWAECRFLVSVRQGPTQPARTGATRHAQASCAGTVSSVRL
jgi:hypothetical protein